MRKILTILLLAVSLIAEADKWHVHPGGSDTDGDGSATWPWLTVKHATDTISGANFIGDTIFIDAGTFNESAQIVKALNVSIMGQGQGVTIINSTYNNASNLQAAIQCASTDGTTTDDGGSISYITLTGSNLTAGRGIFVGFRNNVEIHHCTIEDFTYYGIYFYATRTSYPDLFMAWHSVHDCIITNCSNNATGYSGNVRALGTDGLLIYNCTFDNRERAAGSNGNSITTSRNKRLKVYNNTFYRNDSEIASDGTYGWNFFIENWDYRGDCEYYNNTHYGLAKVSIGGELNAVDDDCTYGFKVYNNVFLNAANAPRSVNGNEEDYYCITVEGDEHKKVEIYNNYIQRYNVGIAVTTPSAGAGYWMTHTWYWDSITIHHNIIENVGYSDFQYGGFGVWWINGTPTDFGLQGEYNNVTIANNTITGNNGGAYHGYAGIGIYANGEVNNLLIANNIITGFSLRGITINEHADDSLTINGLNVIHNDMYDNTSNDIYIESAAERITITDSDVATGNITSDPLFVSASDFHLQSTSPCINTGADVSATTGGTDFHGASLYGAAYDIGAFEYGVGRMILIGTTIPTINYKIPLIDH